MKVSTNLSKNLHRIIRERGITQSYIAKQLNIVPTTVNAWFRGANYPRYEMLEKLANVLGVTVEELTKDSDSNEQISRENIVATPVAGSDTPNPAIKGGDDKLVMGKTKEFWQIMSIVDDMDKSKQQDLLAMLKFMNKNQNN